MTALNPIIAGYTTPLQPLSPVGQPGNHDHSPGQKVQLDQQPVDRYTPGSAHSQQLRPSVNKGGCHCGQCSRCAAGVYERQSAAVEQGSAQEKADNAEGEEPLPAVDEKSSKTSPNVTKGPDGEPLNQQEMAQVAQLQARDAEVRAHEQAHLSAAGGLATSGMSFQYQKGPDGRRYAVGGEVSIDTSQGSTPAETISKMARVRAAALAPASPSSQDRKVAAAASRQMSEARQQLQLDESEARQEAVKEAADALAGEKKSSAEAEESSAPALGPQLAAYAKNTSPIARPALFQAVA